MIGKLKGVVDSLGEDFVILDVQGVGYIVHCSSRTLRKLSHPGEAVALAIETHMREDSIKLYGFVSESEREWFRLLQSVQGVGAKVALAIQAVLEAAELASAIGCQDKAALARAPGVGPKLAARIVAELKERMPAPGAGSAAAQRSVGGETAAAQDAILALVNLGYGRGQAAAAVTSSLASLGEGASASELVRLGLRELSR